MSNNLQSANIPPTDPSPTNPSPTDPSVFEQGAQVDLGEGMKKIASTGKKTIIIIVVVLILLFIVFPLAIFIIMIVLIKNRQKLNMSTVNKLTKFINYLNLNI
jgi:hypothetical protein